MGDVYLALGSYSANRQGFTLDEFSKRKCHIPPLMALWECYCFSPLMSGREPNYQRRPSGFISVTHFNRWVLWLLIRLGLESAQLMRKLSGQEPWYTNKTTIQLIITYCLIMSWERWAIITSYFLFFVFLSRNIPLSCVVGCVCFNSDSQKELSLVQGCWKRALCVCWQWEEIGTGGGLPTLLFKYTLHYWVTAVGVGVDSVGQD